jgi:hypothetical protein
MVLRRLSWRSSFRVWNARSGLPLPVDGTESVSSLGLT